MNSLGYWVDLKITSDKYEFPNTSLTSELDYDCYFKKMENNVEMVRKFRECHR